MRNRLSTRLVVAAALAATSAPSPGCGGGGPSLVEVTGTVSLNGEPLEGATVLFSPVGAGGASTATDVTGPEGNYSLMTLGRKGIAPGKYLVLVSKEDSSGGPGSQASFMFDEAGNPIGEDIEMKRMEAESMASAGGPAAATQKVKVEESGEREVPAEGGVFDFDLKASTADAAKLRAG